MLFKQKNRAFTLIELMVVVAIIGILTAIVLANLTQAKAKARDAKRISDLGQIQLAFETFFDRCNKYPSTLSVNDSCTADGINVKVSDYISAIPTSPAPPQYEYGLKTVNGVAIDYVLKATLELDNAARIDVVKTNYTTFSPAVDCSASATLAYCVLPR